LAHSLRIQVVAEGVETRAQLDFLAALNCDYIQGNYLSEAQPTDTFERQVLATHFPDSMFGKRASTRR
jgi:EAL domain-containing protein (putative c-di-GMP-specific phosphodiesterase class I)